MAWATPIIHSVGDILTASDWNISSNDLSFLGDLQTNFIGTNETTTSIDLHQPRHGGTFRHVGNGFWCHCDPWRPSR